MLVELTVDRSLSGANVKLGGWHGAIVLRTIRFADRHVNIGRVQQPSGRFRKGFSDLITLSVSPFVAATLRLPRERCRLYADEADGDWRLGPCLAVYARATADKQRKFGEQTQMFQDLSQEAKRRGVDFVVIGPGFRQSHRGWRYESSVGHWRLRTLPTPDVVLRRSGSFAKGDQENARSDLAWFSRTGRLHTLPATCSNKFLFYQLLKSVPGLRSYAPRSTVATSATQVWQAVKNRRNVYVKPISGAQGVSVLRINREGAKVRASWEVSTAKVLKSGTLDVGDAARVDDSTRPVSVRTRVMDDITAFRQFWIRTGLKRCLVQDTVPLPRTRDGQPYDLRWLIQCVEEPRVIARVARIGQVGAVTTNIHTGGEAVDAVTLLKELLGAAKASQVLRELDDAALAVATELTRRFGQFAEAGLDMALRDDDSLAIFEVNPTPGRRMLRCLSSELREMSLATLLEYAIHATGFTASVD